MRDVYILIHFLYIKRGIEIEIFIASILYIHVYTQSSKMQGVQV